MVSAQTISIAGRRIGPDHPPYVVAEMSGNHNGDIERAFRILDAAKAAGADAVKIQTYRADTITIDHSGPGFVVDGGLWVLRDGGPISSFAAKTVDQAVGRDLERQRVKARGLPLADIVQKLRQAFLGDIFSDILGMTATTNIDQHRMPNRSPIRIRKFGVSKFTAGLSGGVDPKSYGGVILTHAGRHRCGL